MKKKLLIIGFALFLNSNLIKAMKEPLSDPCCPFMQGECGKKKESTVGNLSEEKKPEPKEIELVKKKHNS